MSAASGVLVNLFVIYFVARVVGELFTRLRQPAVIGELLAGILIGPFALGLVGRPSAEVLHMFNGDQAAAREAMRLVLDVIAELGVIVLLFAVGLGVRLRELLVVGPRSLAVGIGGVVLPFLGGFIVMELYGYSPARSLFVATALVATSVGITARVFRDLGVLGSIEARIILGAAVIDDILAMILLAVVSGLALDDGVQPLHIAFVALQALAFVAFVAGVGSRAVRTYHLRLDRVRIANAPLVVSLTIMLGLAALSAVIGLAAIIGAFLAGMVLAEASEQYELQRAVIPIYEFLVPFFFVVVGMEVDPRELANPSVIVLAVIVTAVAIAGKIAGAWVGARGVGRRAQLAVGIGMVPRGEVGLIVASLGLSFGIVDGDVFSVIIIVVLATTILAPPVLQRMYRDRAVSHPAQEHAG